MKWAATGERISVAHPNYLGERHTIWVYRVEGLEPEIMFAAGDFSNGVWGFYLKRT